MDSAVVDKVQNALQIGKSQCDSYVQERLIDRSKWITDPIKKNNLPLLSTLGKKCQSKEKAPVALLKEDCSHGCTLRASVEMAILTNFSSTKTNRDHPSFHKWINLEGDQKADLVKCLAIINKAKQPPVDAIILDGAAAVQMIPLGAVRTFGEYVDMVLQPFILKQLESASRIDIVWDVYWKDSLKSATREKRGSGTQ